MFTNGLQQEVNFASQLFFMKTLLIALAVTLTFSGKSIYDFKVAGLDGKTIDLSAYKGKKILIVNTASQCGLTPQYEDLQKLFTKYQDKLVVIGFPANNFGQQEPGSNDEIKSFCQKNYGVTFPMAEKVSVTGEDIHPLFQYLVQEAKKLGTEDPVIKWNFTKFLVDEKGNLVKVFSHRMKPMDEEILKHLN